MFSERILFFAPNTRPAGETRSFVANCSARDLQLTYGAGVLSGGGCRNKLNELTKRVRSAKVMQIPKAKMGTTLGKGGATLKAFICPYVFKQGDKHLYPGTDTGGTCGKVAKRKGDYERHYVQHVAARPYVAMATPHSAHHHVGERALGNATFGPSSCVFVCEREHVGAPCVAVSGREWPWVAASGREWP
jgi:hypothetical protein